MTGSSEQRVAPTTRTRIRRAALTLFETHGYEKTTVAQVAAAAEVDPMTVYRHFGTKHGLALRLGDDPDTPRRLGEALAAAGAPGAPLLDAVETVATNWVQQASVDLLAEAFRVARLTATTPELRHQAWSNVAGWAENFDRWVTRLQPQTKHLQAELASRLAVSIVVAAGLDWAASSGSKEAALTALDTALTTARNFVRG